VDENARKAIAGEIDAIKPLEGDALGNKMRAPLEKSFEELDTLLKDHGDWRTKSGLVLTTSKADGTSEYVLDGDKAAYEERGASLFASGLPPLPPAQTAEANSELKAAAAAAAAEATAAAAVATNSMVSGRTSEAVTGGPRAVAPGNADSGCCKACSLQ